MAFKNYFKCLFISFSTNNFIFKYFTSFLVRFGYLNKIKLLIILAKMTQTLLYKKLHEITKKYLIQSSQILKQLPYYLDDFVVRIKNAKLYYDNLKDINEIQIPQFEKTERNGWINFPILYKKRNKLLKYLFLNNRDLAIYFYRDCNQLEIFSEYKNMDLTNIAEVVNEIIILPTYPKYDEKQILTNIKLIREYFNK